MKTQSDSTKYEGECKFCGGVFTKREIVSHLDKCEKRKDNRSTKKYLRLIITDKYIKNFWLIAEVDKEAKFKDLDKFIRNIWVECCEHLSLFGDYGSTIGMNRVIMDTLHTGESIPYIYDFGSSTELVIKAHSFSNFKLEINKKIELAGRNYLPKSDCMKCGKQAKKLCTYCTAGKKAFFCENCAKSHHKSEDCNIMNLANSPRAGVCGYEQSTPLDTLF